MKTAVVASIVLAVLFGTMAYAQGPIYCTKNITVVSESKEIMAGLAEAARKVSKEDFRILVMDMLILNEAKLLPKGLTVECVFDCGDHFLGRIIDTTFETTGLIGKEYWFITLTVPPNTA